MPDPYGQGTYAVRLDWGPVGAHECAADAAVVVDVLSFSTTVTVAVERGARVFPCSWQDPRAVSFAAERDAVLAVGRLEARSQDGPPLPSLSPASLLRAGPPPRLVLPSPNGSTICAALARTGSVVAIGCLRNASAAAGWAARKLASGRSVVVAAAGERWRSDGSLRPALEDHLGAGAILARVADAGHTDALSPEAQAAAHLYRAHSRDLDAVLRGCVGGRELADLGFTDDVSVAAELDASSVVPVLDDDGAFAAA